MRILSWFDDDANRAKVRRYGLYAIIFLVAAALAWSFIPGARADGISGKGKIAAADAARRSWTGIYGGAYGGYATGEVSESGDPTGVSATGPLVGVNAGITVQTGQIVWGAEIAHSWFFGNLSDVSVNREIEYTGRVGVLWNPQALVYVHGSFAQLDTAEWGQIDGWKFGPGVEVKLPSEGWSIDFRGGYAVYDVTAITDRDANMLWGRVGIVKRFDLPAGWLGQ
jgi:hypothetical protein